MISKLPDKFQWWVGVVEDRKDPIKMGRVRVRIEGIHTADKSTQGIPTDHLPWAELVLPVSMEERIVPPKEGSRVIGFFKDKECQFPVIFGVIPGLPTETSPNYGKASNQQQGFYDPVGLDTTNELLKERPIIMDYGFSHTQQLGKNTINRPGAREYSSMLNNTYPKKDRLNEPDTHRLARNENLEKTILKWKIDNRLLNVVSNGTTDGSSIKHTTWSEPDPSKTYGAKYPYNKVMETESGHIMEFDDTLGAERIHLFHRSGTFDEMIANGDRIQKTFGNHYRIVYGDDHYFCFGTRHESFGGNKQNTFYEDHGNIVGGDRWNITHGNDLKSSKGSISSWSGGKTHISSEDSVDIRGEKGVKITALSGGLHLKSDKNVQVEARSSLQLLGIKEINAQAANQITMLSPGAIKITSGSATMIHSTSALTLQSTIYASLTAATAVDIAATGAVNISATAAVNIGAAGIVRLSGGVLMLNCGFSMPSIKVPGLLAGVACNIAEEAEPAAKGDEKIPDPTTLNKGLKK